MESSSTTTRHSCAKLVVQQDIELPETEPIFVKGEWSDSRFALSITDGFNAWTCSAGDAEVRLRAEQWDQPVSDYVTLAERYLAFQQPGSRYAFEDAGDGHRRLSWTFEKQGTKLEWRWKCKPAPDSKQTTASILDFLMDANIRLSDEVVSKSQLLEKLKAEADRCFSQTEKFNREKAEFESSVFSKFVAILNSKKAKLRELRDRLSKVETAPAVSDEEQESSGRTESFREGSDEEKMKEESFEESDGRDPSASENIATSTLKGRKRRARF